MSRTSAPPGRRIRPRRHEDPGGRDGRRVARSSARHTARRRRRRPAGRDPRPWPTRGHGVRRRGRRDVCDLDGRRRRLARARSTRGRGVVTGARNLPGEGAPIRVAAGFKTLAGTRAYVDNDVTVGVNAEYALGAARRSKSLLGRLLGHRRGRRPRPRRRAVGGPRRRRRARPRRREARTARACTCGRRGCMEAYAGRGAMEMRARSEHKRGRQDRLFKIMEKRGRTRLDVGRLGARPGARRRPGRSS